MADDGLALHEATSGNAAQAVGWSAANPFIFAGMDVRRAKALDPGGDRLAAVPVSDACRLFPKARLWVVNVTGQPTVLSQGTACPVREITVPRLQHLDPEDLARGGKDFARLIAAGRSAAAAALSGTPTWQTTSRQ